VNACRAALLALTLAAFGLLGCAAASPPPPPDPIAILTDRQAALPKRRRAVVALDEQPQWTSTEQAALFAFAWDDTQTMDLRLEVLRRLADHDESVFIASALERLPRAEMWPIIEAVGDLTTSHQWTRMRPALVRSWARPSITYADEDRPERKALVSLYPKTDLAGLLRQNVNTTDAAVELAEQAAAWEVLSRLMPKSQRETWLGDVVPYNAFASDLKAAYADLRLMPASREEILWLLHLRQPENQALWQRAAAAIAKRSDHERHGLALRHVPLLAAADLDDMYPFDAAKSRQLADALASQLHAAPHFGRGIDAENPTQVSQRFEDVRDKLTWPDLLQLTCLLNALRDEALVGQWFSQADADLADTTTEHGGVLMLSRPPQAKAFPPLLRLHDRRFNPSPEMIDALYTGLAHYHFHAQSHDNAAFAGPGGGDIELARRLPAAFLVFTFIDRDTLNVDYYQRLGDSTDVAVIDLGVIHRP
jgi:hypothetical protein